MSAIARDERPIAPRQNLTHRVLAGIYDEGGHVATDTPEMAAARGQISAIQRQQGEDQAPFRRALEKLQKAGVSVPSWELLASRCSVKLAPEEVDGFADALRIYPTKDQVVDYNHQHMLGLASPVIQVEAKHEGVGADRVESRMPVTWPSAWLQGDADTELVGQRRARQRRTRHSSRHILERGC